jgi:hypothetical protein
MQQQLYAYTNVDAEDKFMSAQSLSCVIEILDSKRGQVVIYQGNLPVSVSVDFGTTPI